VRAANQGGGDDNITAVLFEMVAGDGDVPAPAAEPDEQTRELHDVHLADDEDTLHPGEVPAVGSTDAADNGGGTSAVDTMVVPAAEIRAALAEQEPSTPQAGLGRRLLALLVIFALIAVIVVLVWWGLAR
jgi:hypothetical protein